MKYIKSFDDLLPGDILTISADHPHGPTDARVIALEEIFGLLKPRCRALDKFGDDDYDDPAEFFVMDGSDVLGVTRP